MWSSSSTTSTNSSPGSTGGEPSADSVVAVRERLLDDLDDLVADEFVAVDQRVPQSEVHVLVLGHHGAHPLTLRLEDVLDATLGLLVPEDLRHEVRLREGTVRDR